MSKGAKLDAENQRGFLPLHAALGLAGGSGGFDGSRRDVHAETAEIIRQLMADAGLPLPLDDLALPE